MSNSRRLSPSIIDALLKQIKLQYAAIEEAHRLDMDAATNLISRDEVLRRHLAADWLHVTAHQLQMVTTVNSFAVRVDDFLEDSNTQLADLEDVLERLVASETAETLFNIVRQLLPQADFWNQLNQLKTLMFPHSEITLLDALVQKYLKVEMPSPNPGLSLSVGQCSSLSDACPLMADGLLERFERLQNFSFTSFGEQLKQLGMMGSDLDELIGQPGKNLVAQVREVMEAIIFDLAAVQARLNAAKVKFEETLNLYSYVPKAVNVNEQLQTFFSCWFPFVADFAKQFVDTLAEAATKYNAEKY